MSKSFTDGYRTYDTSKGFGNERKWKRAWNERISPEEARERVRAQSMTPFELLGIADGASQEEIKLAYRKKMKEWHPDLNAHRLEEATAMAKLINAAYSLLIK